MHSFLSIIAVVLRKLCDSFQQVIQTVQTVGSSAAGGDKAKVYMVSQPGNQAMTSGQFTIATSDGTVRTQTVTAAAAAADGQSEASAQGASSFKR
jgi:hypothetical protein